MVTDNFQQAYQKALNFLSYRMRSSKEIYDKLKQKGFSDHIIQEAIDKLKSYKFLDDISFASRWLEDGLKIRRKGFLFLKKELKYKGISSDIVEDEIKKYTSEDEYKTAFQAASHKKHKKDPQKMGLFLKSRGFSYEVIQKVLKNIYKLD